MEFYGKATTAKGKTEEATAREILALTLLGAGQEKHTNSSYDENTWLNAYIQEQNKDHDIVINENKVSVDGWEFEIDRSIPAIKGEGTQSGKDNSIQIRVKQVVHVEKKELKIEIITEKEIKTITINGKEVETIPKKINGKYSIQKEVQETGNYEIKAIASDDTWNTASIKITEEIPIYDKEDMITFRDLVNSGNTFEGKTVALKNDIDLEGTNENQWTPIGTEEKDFKGLFDGNSKTIRGLYINNGNVRDLGLFGFMSDGEIKRVKLQDCHINSTWNDTEKSGYVGGIVGRGSKVRQCSVTGELSFDYGDNVTVNTWMLGIGGIAGNIAKGLSPAIEECYNGANILISIKKSSSKAYQIRAGGIVSTGKNAIIKDCYNTGDINTITTSEQTVKGKGGIVGVSENSGTFLNIDNSYNTGIIDAGGDVGAILGIKSAGNDTINNCYYLDVCGGSNANGGIVLTQEQIQTETFVNILNKKENYSNTLDWTSKYQEGNHLLWGYKENKPVLKWQID